MEGLEGLLGRIRHVGQAGITEARQVKRAQAEQTLLQAQQLAPTDTGALVESGHLEETSEGWDVVFDAPYAVFVHENLALQHPDGQAKFLESAVLSDLDRFAAEDQEALNRVIENA